MDVYDRIDRLLKEKGVSRRKAAQMAGIIPGTLNSALYRKKGLSAAAVSALAQALDVDANYLLYGDINPFLMEAAREMAADPDPGYGRRIKAIREVLKISLSDLASTTGMELNRLEAVEAEKIGISMLELESLAHALSVDVTALMPEEEAKARTQLMQRTQRHIAIAEQREGFIAAYDALNDTGKEKAIVYVTDLVEQPKYLKPGVRPLGHNDK